jgi:hypothetical protein
MSIDRLIGFDIRLGNRTSELAWNEERRSLFLLRDDIQRPLSVDQTVWPSCFPKADRDQWRGVLGHWSDFDAMSDAAERLGIDLASSFLLSTVVAWDLLSAEERDEWATKRLDQAVPERPGPEWSIVGYDVADQWLTSGLSNCGYVGNERTEWRSRWGGRVNEFHLFDDPSEASIFAKATNQRVPEHAPFFVYGLLERLTNPK